MHDEGRYHIETSPLIYRANQWAGFYMITASVIKELIIVCFYFGCGKFCKFNYWLYGPNEIVSLQLCSPNSLNRNPHKSVETSSVDPWTQSVNWMYIRCSSFKLPTPWTKGVNWTYMRLKYVQFTYCTQGVCTSNLRLVSKG